MIYGFKFVSAFYLSAGLPGQPWVSPEGMGAQKNRPQLDGRFFIAGCR
jgi:hypothetical protein